jgi:hypothetical protein
VKRLGLRLVWCALGSLAAASAAEGWRETLTPPVADAVPPPPFRASYSFGWSNLVKSGEAKTTFSDDGKTLKLTAKGGTLGLARRLWRIDVEHEVELDRATQRPLAMRQVEKYSNRTVETNVRFGPDEIRRLRRVSIDDPSKSKWKKIKPVEAVDLAGAMLFVRSQPLRDGDTVRLVAFPGDSTFLASLEVEGREKLEIAGKEWNTIRLGLTIRRIQIDDGKAGELAPHAKFRSGKVWVSDDALRLPLRAEVSIFIGFVYGELTGLELIGAAEKPR